MTEEDGAPAAAGAFFFLRAACGAADSLAKFVGL